MIDIRELRKESNLSVSELAAKLELSESSCYDLETHPEDIYMTMSIRQVVELMKALNIPPDLLFADSRGGRELLYSIDDWKKCLEQEIEMKGLVQLERSWVRDWRSC